MTRAAFLRLFGMAVAGIRIDPVAAATSSFSVDRAKPSHFQPLVDAAFPVSAGNGSPRVRLRLAKVLERPATKDVERFSLVFHGPPDRPLSDGIHAFHHPALGSFSIFIVPIGAPVDGRRVYQACFSRHVRT